MRSDKASLNANSLLSDVHIVPLGREAPVTPWPSVPGQPLGSTKQRYTQLQDQTLRGSDRI